MTQRDRSTAAVTLAPAEPPPEPGAKRIAERVAAGLDRIAEIDRPEVWISLRDRVDVLEEARTVQARLDLGANLPLAGATVAVKDNIDVAGLPTTAGCPAFAYSPSLDAPSVARLRAAGAIVLGKANLDQFATGLVGTRSPYGPVRAARDAGLVAGGSSSGSAVAVALGLADLGLGTDTAGSGRVPAAFQKIVGVKPTRGLVPVRGVVPACRSFDCVSVFARSLAAAEQAFGVIAGPDAHDPSSRRWPADAPLAAPDRPRIAIASLERLTLLDEEGRRALEQTYRALGAAGAELVEIDIEPFLAAGELLYGGAFLAERYAAVGSFIAAHRSEVDPVVAEIVLSGAEISAERYVADRELLDRLHLEADGALGQCDALLLPTAPFHPTIDQVAADPISLNYRLGSYTSFCNLLDLCAIALPGSGGFGVTLLAPAFHDAALADLAERFLAGAPSGTGAASDSVATGAPGAELLVVGAHMRGGALNGELTGRGGRLLSVVHTAPCYRLYRLATSPPKPGLVRAAAGVGVSIEGELWQLPPAGLASLLTELPNPMALGRVELEDGSSAVGFLCEPAALGGAEEITAFGGWRAYTDRNR